MITMQQQGLYHLNMAVQASMSLKKVKGLTASAEAQTAK